MPYSPKAPAPNPATRVDLPAPDVERKRAEAIRLFRAVRDNHGKAKLTCACGACPVLVDLDSARYRLEDTLNLIERLIEHARTMHETPQDIVAEVVTITTIAKVAAR